MKPKTLSLKPVALAIVGAVCISISWPEPGVAANENNLSPILVAQSEDDGDSLLGGDEGSGSGDSLLGGDEESGGSGDSLLGGDEGGDSGSGDSLLGGEEDSGSDGGLLGGEEEESGDLLGGEEEEGATEEEATAESEETAGEMHAELFISNRYPSATECAACHPRHYKQWSMSQHAYAQMSPVFNAMQGRISQLINGTLGDFCIRCHTPVGMNTGEDEFMSNIDRSSTSREGVTCVVCHRIDKPWGKVSGRLAIVEGPLTDPIYGPTGNNKQINAAIERGVVQTDPEAFGRKIHQKTVKFSTISSSVFCGSCHDVLETNNFRLEEAFSEWEHSPAAAKGIDCQDCHMGKVPGAIVEGLDPKAPDFDEKNYERGPAAVIGGNETEPRKLTNHYFAGPDYSVLPPSLFPLNEKAIKEESEKGDPTAQGLATIRDWIDFDWKAGWGTDEFEDKVFENPDKYEFPERWSSVDSRYTAREIIQENLESMRFMRNRRLTVMRNAFNVSDIEVTKADASGLAFRLKVASATDGHGAPTGFEGERLFWLKVQVMDANGNVVFESGDADPNGDLRDLHSRYVHNHEMPLDDQLFSLQSKFLTRNLRGPAREQVLAVPYALTPLPFLNRPSRAGVLFGRPFVSRKHRQGILPGDHRWAKYEVDGSMLSGPGPYKVVAEFKVQMIPVNLVIAILKIGFDYELDARTIARRVVDGYVDDEGNQIIWDPESDKPEDNKVTGNEVLYRREATIEMGS